MTVGITFGAWDLLHPGHVHFLSMCKSQCDELLVGLHVNPFLERPTSKEIPTQSLYERWYQLQGLDIDSIIPYETEEDLRNIVAMVSPLNYYFLGSDYLHKNLHLDLIKIIQKRDIEVKYIDRLHNYSSTELRKRLRQHD